MQSRKLLHVRRSFVPSFVNIIIIIIPKSPKALMIHARNPHHCWAMMSCCLDFLFGFSASQQLINSRIEIPQCLYHHHLVRDVVERQLSIKIQINLLLSCTDLRFFSTMRRKKKKRQRELQVTQQGVVCWLDNSPARLYYITRWEHGDVRQSAKRLKWRHKTFKKLVIF